MVLVEILAILAQIKFSVTQGLALGRTEYRVYFENIVILSYIIEVVIAARRKTFFVDDYDTVIK